MLRTLTAAIFAALTALPAAAHDPADMSPAERDAFGAAVREYLLDNPQVIMEAVQILEARQRAAQTGADRALIAAHRAAIFEDGFSFVGGNPDGDITLVEFLDYRCGYCRKAHPDVAKLLEFDGNIRLIVKEFPILGEQSVLASRFAIATMFAHGDTAYKQVSDALMTYDGDFTAPALERIARGFDLDPEAIFARIDDDAVSDIITANHDLARSLDINGTPTFVLEDMLLRGYVALDQMLQIVDDVRG